MNKRLSLVILIVFMIFLSSCGNNSDNPNNNAFIGGTNGILISFQENAPPKSIFDNSQGEFNIAVNLKNDGEYKVNKNDITVRIDGISPSDFGVSSSSLIKHPSEDIEPKKKDIEGNTIIEAAPVIVEFPNLKYKNKLIGNQVFSIRAKVCYRYKTKATSLLCIRQNVMSYDPKAVCKINEQKPISSSGAPVQITNFKENVGGKNKISFTFDIEKKNNGEIFKPGSKCNYDYKYINMLKVTIDPGLPGLDCYNIRNKQKLGNKITGYVYLNSQGKTTVSCSLNINAKSDYTKPINIELEYDYGDEAKTQITVKHIEN